MKNKNYHSTSFKSVLLDLKSKTEGLEDVEVQKRLKKYGKNKLSEEKKISKIALFLNQFKSPLIYILLLAALISAFFKEFIDAYVILSAVFLNTIIGYFQENKANSDLSKLRSKIKHQVFVRRDNRQFLINTEELVPGDIIFLQAGTRISADARLIEASELMIDESSLTGESVPVEKSFRPVPVGASLGDRRSMAYMGTVVLKGRALAIVVATGMNTEIGKIADLIKETKDEETPLQIRLKKLGNYIGILSSIISLLIFVVGILLGRNALEMFLVSVAVAVSSIPEGLPIAITVVLTIGMQSILKKKSLVRRLVAAETLGSTTVICTDKTGTLTLGEMKVANIIANGKEFDISQCDKKACVSIADVSEILKIGVLCNDAFFEENKINNKKELAELKVSGSPTDRAMLLSGFELGISLKEELLKYPRIAESSFDSLKKYMLTVHDVKDKPKEKLILCKGAPEIVLKKCLFMKTKEGNKKISSSDLAEIEKTIKNLTSRGLRLIAVAKKEVAEKNYSDKVDENFQEMVLLGLVALRDPLRKEAKETIKICRQAGIRPIIITGDHKLTAKAVAEEIGFEINKQNILNGDELDEISDADLREKVKFISLYARVSPHHKLRIVKALQENKEVVAMAGDGINDAPALQMADIGIALGSGTDIAKETAEIVLLNDNFSTIVNAVRQGRIIFDNLRKIIVYLMSDSFSGMLLMLGAIIFGLPLPLVPAQILWINIVNDGLPNFALAFEKGDKDIMKRKPLPKDEPILDKEMKFLIFVIGIFTDIGLFLLFFILLKTGHDIPHIRTYMFAALGTDSLIYVFSCKNLRKNLRNTKLFDNKFLILAVLISFALLLVGIYIPFFQNILRTIPLGGEGWLIMLGVAVFEVMSIEFGKWLFIHKRLRFKK